MAFIPPFDETKEFVTAGPFRAAGRAWGKGFIFDKSTVNPKTLRLLYEGHKLITTDHPRAAKLLGKKHSNVPPVPKPVQPASERRAVARKQAEEEKTEDAKVAKLMKLSKAELLKRGSGLETVKKSMNKTEIATALVRHGAS